MSCRGFSGRTPRVVIPGYFYIISIKYITNMDILFVFARSGFESRCNLRRGLLSADIPGINVRTKE